MTRRHSQRSILFVSIFAMSLVLTACGNSEKTSATIGTTGGRLTLAKFGSVSFPAGAFAKPTKVTLSVSRDERITEAFGQSAVVFRAGSELSYALDVATESVQPSGNVTEKLVVPESFRKALPANAEVRAFAENLWEGGQESLDTFELLPERFSAKDSSVTVSVRDAFFAPRQDSSGFEEVILLASTPTKPESHSTRLRLGMKDLGPNHGLRFKQQPGVCEGTTLGPPLAGDLVYTSHFGPRNPNIGASGFHWGSDLRAADGTPVLAMADGTIVKVGHDNRTAPDGRHIGAGDYVVVMDEDGSRTVYAHLTPGSETAVGTSVKQGDQIAQSDTTGGATGPHLHIEYVPNGLIYNRNTKVDPEPCIGSTVSGSITVGDNGNWADDSFTVAINGAVICRTQIGATNTCAVGNLRPGTATLTITAVVAPDDEGTYGIVLSNGVTFDDGSTTREDVLPEGESDSFMIVIPAV